jgi:hypothetical protein
MLRSLKLFGLLTCLLAFPTVAVAQQPQIIFDKSIGGVVWIQNYVNNGVIGGSGFLAERNRRLIVTNYHVTDGEETMDVFFPYWDARGNLVDDPKFYLKNSPELKKSKHYLAARVVAHDRIKDLAIIQVYDLPATAVQLSLATKDPGAKDQLHILGNPAERNLWQWGAGVEPTVERFRGKRRNDNTECDFHSVAYAFNGFGGNSGGPVLNAKGEVVGIHTQGGGKGNIASRAVHYSEVKELLGTITPHRVWSVNNTTKGPLHYQVRWGAGEWKNHTVAGGWTDTHWLPGHTAAKPQIRFDNSTADGFQEKIYDISYFTSDLGRNVQPSVALDAKEHHFQWDKAGTTLEFFLTTK